MPIPEDQLDTWSHQGAIQGSSATYNAVKTVLESSNSPYADKDYEVFLQGSYGNDTNIYAESDVDIIIKLNEAFGSDLSLLREDEKSSWRNTFHNATYRLADFKNDVHGILTNRYGNDVKLGDKAISIDANGNRRKADVIPAISFRRYFRFNGLYDQDFVEGICFYNKAGNLIANYPKQHSENLTRKHQESNQWLKPMVRILKNLRSKLVDDGLLKAGIAPSYYLEGLLYNVPGDKFTTSYEDSFVNAINWIQKDADKAKLVCANEQYYLLRDDALTCWPRSDGEAFLNAAIKLWNEW
jgi:hypothetical protein